MKKTLSMLVMVTLLLGFATVLPTTAQTKQTSRIVHRRYHSLCKRCFSEVGFTTSHTEF